ncbi:MAG: single-stranded-DNA-specific exonuclease RecJ [Candidatus Euphemobacter frigidus]|nr:single-stranded-DNA-specific exonuclease RecJ [Candidatus Euphemobacter frigidus]MDP8275538.1 single-stranded-DNA-specific exonuclease RecJ [Candidatus Euphemobacter frigidus]
MIWRYQPVNKEMAQQLAREVGVSLPLAHLLIKRGYSEPSSARRFLNPQPSHLHDPYLMADMKKAVERLGRALDEKEKIFVFGDYDVDGVTSIAVLSELLDRAGARYLTYQPNRLKEGYGLSREGVELALKADASLLFALDCGTEAGEAIEYARSRGLDVIVIDHHKQRGELPPAHAVLNPNRVDCPYPFKNLAAVGVVFKFLHAGLSTWNIPVDWERLYQLAALGTVADVVPLVDENRVLVKVGLYFLEQKPDPALRALLEVARGAPDRLEARHLAFQLAPRLNAAGRMGRPEIGRRLLGSRDQGEIRELAEDLDRMNYQRRSIQADIFNQAVARIEADRKRYLGNVIVVEGEGWNKGIVGIVAAKLQEKYYRPTVVIALEGEKGTGSARSIPGFDLFNAVSRCSELLEAFGGHKSAAGLRIDRSRIDEFRSVFDQVAGEMLGKDGLTPVLPIDGELDLEEATIELIEEVERLAPFGMGNRRPVFRSSELTIAGSPQVMGKAKNHLKLRLKREGSPRECVGWEMAHRIGDLDAEPIDIVYQLKVDTFRNQRRVQLVLKDFHPSVPDKI